MFDNYFWLIIYLPILREYLLDYKNWSLFNMFNLISTGGLLKGLSFLFVYPSYLTLADLKSTIDGTQYLILLISTTLVSSAVSNSFFIYKLKVHPVNKYTEEYFMDILYRDIVYAVVLLIPAVVVYLIK